MLCIDFLFLLHHVFGVSTKTVIKAFQFDPSLLAAGSGGKPRVTLEPEVNF